MENILTKIQESSEYIQSVFHNINNPVGIILGTGLGKLASKIEVIAEISYSKIPWFPVSTVESHSGKLLFGHLNGVQVIALQGRFHYYEGYSLQQITFPIRVLNQLGIRYLLISNAAGAVNLSFKKGSLMLINDHINLLMDNPLIGKNLDDFGQRFPDMSSPYSERLNDLAKKIAVKHHLEMNEGVYTAMSGPTLETRAEYRMLGVLGTDAIGMSTVPEVIVANHMGLECMAISVLTDECDPDNLVPVGLDEIIEVASKAESKLVKIFEELVLEA